MAGRVCPVWIGRLLASPIRRLIHNPETILGPYITKGMTVLEPGSAMGFFSLPAAKMVGPLGKVICLDLQEEMIRHLRKRAAKAGVADRIETRVCSETSLQLDDLKESADFAFAIAVAHEVPDQKRFFGEIYQTLKPGSFFLFAEPKGHVSLDDFAQSLKLATTCGFTVQEEGKARGSLSALLKK